MPIWRHGQDLILNGFFPFHNQLRQCHGAKERICLGTKACTVLTCGEMQK